MKKIKFIYIIFLFLLFDPKTICAQAENKKDIHQTIIEFDFSFKLHQHARNETNEEVSVINVVDNFFGVRYTNAFFIKKDLSIGLGIGLEMAPVTEFPIVLDIRKYFGEKINKNYMVFNVGQAYSGYSGFGTWLGELGFGRNIKLGKKSTLNISTNYQLTYLKWGKVNETNSSSRWVKNFYTNSLAIKVGLMF
ncbi:hypothetical protein [Marinifilum sp. D737]|uniref:hypothetical protein n=1 Tax=Marinifilum sp. D737 TaxID=2969628 RepID=UPI0022741AA7|nr:hypothetical protein [Marinifilum sp. D737]MCY1632912.1 hypothetical protein [Marinifilum sp. D737]